MTLLRTCAALGAAAVLAACSTTPTSTARFPVPPERIHAPDLVLRDGTRPAAGSVRLSVVREEHFYGGGCSWAMYFNDRHVVTMWNGEGIDLQLPPGRTLVRLDIATFVCPPYSTTREIMLEAGRPVLLWLEMRSGSPFVVTLPHDRQ